jgi:hypothetical protein
MIRGLYAMVTTFVVKGVMADLNVKSNGLRAKKAWISGLCVLALGLQVAPAAYLVGVDDSNGGTQNGTRDSNDHDKSLGADPGSLQAECRKTDEKDDERRIDLSAGQPAENAVVLACQANAIALNNLRMQRATFWTGLIAVLLATVGVFAGIYQLAMKEEEVAVAEPVQERRAVVARRDGAGRGGKRHKGRILLWGLTIGIVALAGGRRGS